MLLPIFVFAGVATAAMIISYIARHMRTKMTAFCIGLISAVWVICLLIMYHFPCPVHGVIHRLP